MGTYTPLMSPRKPKLFLNMIKVVQYRARFRFNRSTSYTQPRRKIRPFAFRTSDVSPNPTNFFEALKNTSSRRILKIDYQIYIWAGFTAHWNWWRWSTVLLISYFLLERSVQINFSKLLLRKNIIIFSLLTYQKIKPLMEMLTSSIKAAHYHEKVMQTLPALRSSKQVLRLKFWMVVRCSGAQSQFYISAEMETILTEWIVE